jgi:hypothetical protein
MRDKSGDREKLRKNRRMDDKIWVNCEDDKNVSSIR